MKPAKITWYPTPTEQITFENCEHLEYERAGGGITFMLDGKWNHLKGGAAHVVFKA